MAFTVRLGPKTERALNALARRRQLTRSDVVREALIRYEASSMEADAGRPYESWADVIGTVGLGARDPGRTTGDQLAAILRGQRRARHPR